MTKIEWTDVSWNPVTGCTPVSEGCANCYARRLALTRLKHNPKYKNGFNVTCHEDALDWPLRFKLKKPHRIFICSMGDLFHDRVPYDFITKVFDVMYTAKDITFQILTKRPKRMLSVIKILKYASINNVWFGFSAENQARFNERIVSLSRAREYLPTSKYFVSFEPLLGPVDFGPWRQFIDWVIVGGETGPDARPMKEEWARNILFLCKTFTEKTEIPFFFKKMGPGKPRNRILNGGTWEEFPV